MNGFQPLLPDTVVLDTGPLLDYLVLLYEHDHPRQCGWLLGRLSDSFRADPLKTALIPFFDAARRSRLLTCPSVVAEIHGHVQEAERRQPRSSGIGLARARFWDLARRHFGFLQLGEETMDLLEMTNDVLRTCGPVDAGVLDVAGREQTNGHSVVVLTADWNLVGAGAARTPPVTVATTHDKASEFLGREL